MKRKHAIGFLATLCYGMLGYVMPVLASDGGWSSDDISDIMRSQGFVGSAEIVNKMSWVGWIVSTIISVCCLIGLAMLAIRIIVSLLYLSNRNLFDQVSEIKKGGQGGSGIKDIFAGLSMYKNLGAASGKTQGLDTILLFLMSLLPDVKAWSDFGESGEFGGDEGALKWQGAGSHMRTSEYILKISIPAILNIFFFSIGYNGTLWKVYTTVAQYAGDKLETICDKNLEASLVKAFGDRFGYTFSFGADGTKSGKLNQDIAEDLYYMVATKIQGSDFDSASQSILGMNVENIVSGINVRDYLTNIDGVSADNDSSFGGIKLDKAYLVPSTVYAEIQSDRTWYQQTNSKSMVCRIPLADCIAGMNLPATEANGGITGYAYFRATLKESKTSVNFWVGDTGESTAADKVTSYSGAGSTTAKIDSADSKSVTITLPDAVKDELESVKVKGAGKINFKKKDNKTITVSATGDNVFKPGDSIEIKFKGKEAFTVSVTK